MAWTLFDRKLNKTVGQTTPYWKVAWRWARERDTDRFVVVSVPAQDGPGQAQRVEGSQVAASAETAVPEPSGGEEMAEITSLMFLNKLAAGEIIAMEDT